MADNSELEQIRKDISELKQDISDLFILCKSIEKKCSTNEEASNKMINHITFIQSVYGAVRTPLEFIRKKMSLIRGDEPNLPLIETEY